MSSHGWRNCNSAPKKARLGRFGKKRLNVVVDVYNLFNSNAIQECRRDHGDRRGETAEFQQQDGQDQHNGQPEHGRQVVKRLLLLRVARAVGDANRRRQVQFPPAFCTPATPVLMPSPSRRAVKRARAELAKKRHDIFLKMLRS